MQPDAPPPTSKLPNGAVNRRVKVLIILALVPALCVGAILALRICGFIRPFSVPTGGMTPAVSVGDHIMMESMTYLARQPHRGDIVVFKTDGIPSLPSAAFYVKRIAGEPGDHVRISEGKLFINEKEVLVSNAVGEIVYALPTQALALSPQTDVSVSNGSYFVLGDNSTNSLDSRFWGSVPRGNIVGRVSFCYWPLNRIGKVQ